MEEKEVIDVSQQVSEFVPGPPIRRLLISVALFLSRVLYEHHQNLNSFSLSHATLVEQVFVALDAVRMTSGRSRVALHHELDRLLHQGHK
eukprot:763057-Hanusia_phi.AAC.4